MKAVSLTQFGGPEVLTYGDLPEPKLSAGEVLIRVHASALNHLDIWRRGGQRGTRSNLAEPLILGCDIAGEVVEVGEGSPTPNPTGPSQPAQILTSRETRERQNDNAPAALRYAAGGMGLKTGDHVIVNPGITCGRCVYCLSARDNMCYGYTMIGSAINGGYAQYAKAPAENVHRIPANLAWEAAAAIPLVTLTAWHMLMGLAKLRPGETVLIQAVGSGVGAAALQVAKLNHARTIVTAGADWKLEKAKELGADVTINYKTEEFAKRVAEVTDKQGVEVVFDSIGAETFEKNLQSMARGGRYVNCGITGGYAANLHIGQLFTKQVQLFGSFMGTKADMLEVARLVNAAQLHGTIGKVFELKEAAEAHRVMESRDFFGKLVLRIP